MLTLPRTTEVRYSSDWRLSCELLSSASCAISRKSDVDARNTAAFAKGSTVSASEPTASTTARTAGKPATFLLPTPVSAELQNIRMQIDVDARLAAAAGGAARYFADAAGLGHDD